MTDIASLTDTWANGATVFTGLKLNVTNTASAAGSLLMDLQIGGSSLFNVDKTGILRLRGPNDNSVTAPTAISFADGGSACGFATTGTALISVIAAGANPVSFGWGTGVLVASGQAFGWGSNIFSATSPDLYLYRDAAGILAQRNSANAQTLRVYNTYTDSSNYERGVFDWTTTANIFVIGMEKLGSGTSRSIRINPGVGGNSAIRLEINDTFSNGNVGFDIREAGTKKWTAASYQAGGTFRSFTFYNEQFTAPGLFIFGDTNVALFNRSGDTDIGVISTTTTLDVVTANNPSTFRELRARSVIHNGVTVANLPGSPTAGQVAYVTDATATTIGSTVAGTGSNKVMVWYNGTAWHIMAN